MQNIFKLLIGLIVIIELLDISGFIIRKCGAGFYGISMAFLFASLCIVATYIFLTRWA